MNRTTLTTVTDSFATLVSECLAPTHLLDALTSPNGLVIGTECTLWYVPALGQVIGWDMVADPEMKAPVRSHTSLSPIPS